MRTRASMVVLAAALVMGAAACIPPDPGPTGLYRGVQPGIRPVLTPRDQPVTWGSAPPIDDHYGGTLYAGTSIEQDDPRPPLLADGSEPLRLWVADPDNDLTGRPAIVWVHGGGFAVGVDDMFGLANGVGRDYARRGYVGFSVEYRIDTTLVGSGKAEARPPSLCQWVQDHVQPGDPVWEARRAQCERNIEAAQHDVQAAVRWIRAHAAEYGVDPYRIAVGGFSAGAVTAANLAYRSDDVGTHPYFPGDDLSVDASKVQAAIGASGCAYPDVLGTPPTYIDGGDARISFIHAAGDPAVPYACAAATVHTARDAGLVAELRSYCDESLHAGALYRAHKDDVDEQWTTFLARALFLYGDMRPATADPTC